MFLTNMFVTERAYLEFLLLITREFSMSGYIGNFERCIVVHFIKSEKALVESKVIVARSLGHQFSIE